MKKRELINLGLTQDAALRAAVGVFKTHRPDRDAAREAVRRVLADPGSMADDPVWGPVAEAVIGAPPAVLRDEPAPLKIWGRVGEDIDQQSVDQARRACELPISVAAALMPDAHVGYGLPIGGVLATRGAVIPYAVGVDIACRIKVTVLDLPVDLLDSDAGRGRLTDAIEAETRFGMGAAFAEKREHDVMDDDWRVSPVTQRLKDKAHAQLGSSGSGNHFVEFGVLTVEEGDGDHPLGIGAGRYLALMSHSGSRGTGAAVCDHYSRIAMQTHPDLDKQHRHLAWLEMDSDAGREYWDAMNLMGRYASANHACIHRHIARNLGAEVIAGVENHHNFAWEETHEVDGVEETLIVHRKGATPAGVGVLGVIPGSMADPAFIVVGKDGAGSLSSASHGAGRLMSRTAAKNTFRWAGVRELLKERGVTVISAGIDENPGVYKDIRRVIALQQDLVEPVARFDPKLVKMAPDGEKAED
ncbi:MAG: RtcB family protein [Phycisphaerales bacterium]|nr:RtcB family protein [Planctomycetota bacterium]MCH8508296.1 RtcB family protein [Phycisphaerales bacterium]